MKTHKVCLHIHIWQTFRLACCSEEALPTVFFFFFMCMQGVSLVEGEAEKLTSEAEDFSSPLIEAIPVRDHCWKQYARCSLCNVSAPPLAIAALPPLPRYCTLSHLSLPSLMTLLWQSACFHWYPALLMNHSTAREVHFMQRAGEHRGRISTLSPLPPSSSPLLSSSSNDAAAESIAR